MQKIVIVIFILFFPYLAHSACTNGVADTCSRADVQECINEASDGDTLTIPSGTCEWTTTVTIPNTKGVTLKGAGIDVTTIQHGVASDENLLAITLSTANEMVRVTGFTFDAQDEVKSGLVGLIYIDGTETEFRIDNCEFYDIYGRGIVIQANGVALYGLIDNNQLTVLSDRSVQAITVLADGPQDDGYWTSISPIGTSNAVYVEDNTFNFSYDNDGVLDCYSGASYVVRYNTIYGATIGHHGADSGSRRSCYSWEIYNNTFDDNSVSISYSFFSRGGHGVVHNNTWTDGYSSMRLTNYRSCASYTYWGQCTGINSFDGNDATNGDEGTASSGSSTTLTSSVEEGWSTDEYIGFYVHNDSEGGEDCAGLISANGSNTLTFSTLGASCSGNGVFGNGESFSITDGYYCLDQNGRGQNQALNAIYEWDNTINSVDADFVNADGCADETRHIQINRDYYNDTEKPNYTPYTYPHPLRGASITFSGGGLTISSGSLTVQ